MEKGHRKRYGGNEGRQTMESFEGQDKGFKKQYHHMKARFVRTQVSMMRKRETMLN